MAPGRWGRETDAPVSVGGTEPRAGSACALPEDPGSFSALLRCHVDRSGLSLTHLAAKSWLDIGYVSRLVNQDYDPLNPPRYAQTKFKHPSRDTVIRLGHALGLPLEDLDELLMAAGYAPLVR